MAEESNQTNQSEEDCIQIGTRTIREKPITSYIEKGEKIYNNDNLIKKKIH